MNNKNIIIAGAIAIGVYLFSQGKSIFSAATASQTTGQRTAQKAAQKVDISRLPVAQIRYMIAHAAALKKTREEVAALKAEEARRVARSKATYKATQKRIGVPISRTAYLAARRKAALRKAVGKKVGKKIGKKVVHKILEETGGRTGMALVRYLQKKAAAMHVAATQAANAVKNNSKIRLPSSKWAGGLTGMALAVHLKKREGAIKRAVAQAKAAITQPTSKLFPGAEKSRIIPYSESSKHSYYGPKSHKLQNEGYRVESNKRLRNSVEAYHDAAITEVLSNPKLWKK